MLLRVTSAMALIGAASSFMISLPAPSHTSCLTTVCSVVSPNPSQPSFSSSRRSIVAGILSVGGAFLAGPVLAEDRPKIPEDQMIKPPSNSCAQGVGGKCEELAEGNPLIMELQKRSAANRLKYQKEELESYWNRNYKDFFDNSCTAQNRKCNFVQREDGTWAVIDKDSTIPLKSSKQ
ncbi:hypothetical protein GUITHDRAFT_155928 [Guillardia theta CCMP2712]|uniref:Uncharacterized protein n=2 Tax=Guillardia theta TaxID=55529 RepID=L1ID49_GUITC|nr:hypothetical protein GUITHDRAFT_155928 [Guillardia theta CCMP2712]EKX33819.1 hypothetical protein GUITHDRAFT_155928 [Guillardia theta CCMP2712]|eukprot:XP_005820799.1 hypothetical protein GUITHDRAFT_155928 [Guillardia theta CCMP2712]